MANERIPRDPYRPSFANDEPRSAARLDNELQPDPELAEGPASSSRITIFAIGIAVVLGAVFYGLNNTSVEQASTSPPAQNTAQNAAPSSPPAAPPGMRDVTPHANTGAGVTTGAAPARPATPPSAAPTGQDANHSGNPTTAAPPASK